MFAAQGDELFIAKDAANAIYDLQKHGPFDAIVSDFNYPGLQPANPALPPSNTGGIDVLKFIHENKIQTPFFFLSGKVGDLHTELEAHGLKLPEDHIYAKPVLYMKIVDEIKERYSPPRAEQKRQHLKFVNHDKK